MAGSYPDKIKTLPVFDRRFDAYKLEAKDADVLFASYPAGTVIPEHSHDTDNYGVITRGVLFLKVNGDTTRYGAGDWYHVPVGTIHSAAFEQVTDEIEFWFDSKK